MVKSSIRTRVALIMLPLLTSLIVWVFGRYQLSPSEVITIIFDWISGNPNIDKQGYLVVVSIRLARIILALLVGMGLSVAGVAFQSLFSNPLTTPDILGVSSGAAFGAALAILLDCNSSMIQLMALIFGIAAVILTMIIANINGSSATIMLILSGIVVTSVFNALLSGIKFVADPQSKLPAISFWLMGSMSNASFRSIAFYSPAIIAGTIIIYILRWKLNILSLSEDEAKAMGINLKLFKSLIIVASTLITASSVALCGIIGWVGLLVPHICRIVFGVNTKIIVPASISFGATFLLLVDTLSRTLLTSELPLGILCSLLGAPIFIMLLRKSKGEL
ncbi:FecCD family ABC transporter permease [Mageeibacillus indolicus]|uniref:FecCD family ABC transporter permease n=1 Tax=Mageeibacillus indolicus TaxID=884684 RepID=UPI0004DD66A5|nr:iron ABC transporter permease [Mageeibacillus indolicus]KFA57267.1 iron ABC transporter permease [Mageeibacillus indolicus 0009-5]